MTNWTVLKAAIADTIKTNDNQEITGQLLQNVLNNIVSSVGENATFVGVAEPTTNPGISDGPVFYLATVAGIYANFGGIELKSGEAVILQWNNSLWAKKIIGFATQEKLSELERKYSIYAPNATGANIDKFKGIKDLIIKNAQDGLCYTIASITKNETSAAVRLYTSVDDIGSDSSLLCTFKPSVGVNSDNREYHYVKCEHGEDVYAVIKWDEIPYGSFTEMWHNRYPLSNKVYQYGINSDSALMEFIKKTQQDLLNNDVPSIINNSLDEFNKGSYFSGDERIQRGGIIECYLNDSITSLGGDVVVSTAMQNNGNCFFTITSDGSVIGESIIKNAPDKIQYPIILHSLMRNEEVVGYILADWSKISNFQGIGTGTLDKKRCSVFHGSSSCLYQYINNTCATIDEFKWLKCFVSDYTMSDCVLGSINYLTGVDTSATNICRTQYISVISDYELNIEGSDAYTGFYVIKYLDGVYRGYEKDKKIIPKDDSFNQIRIRIDFAKGVDSEFASTLKVGIRNTNGVMSLSDSRYLSKKNVVFKQESVALPYVGYYDLTTGIYSGSLNFLTSEYIAVFPGQKMTVLFGGYGNAGIAGFYNREGEGFKVVYKDSSTEPLRDTKNVDIIIPDDVYYIRISSYKSRLDYSNIYYYSSINLDLLKGIINRENIPLEKSLDGYVRLMVLELLTSGIICDYSGYRLNFNIPNDEDKIIISTDIYNRENREDPSINDLIKAFAPMLFYKMQKVGCFVLFDVENENRPFIYDANGNKKYLALTDE